MTESVFDKLSKEIQEGIEGKNQSIPIGFPKLGKYANIRKRVMTLMFSTTGAGKSSLLDSMILNSCMDYMDNNRLLALKPDYQLFSTERSKQLRIAKWICYRIFITEGVEIQLPRMLGWWDEKLTKGELDLINRQKEFIDCLLNDFITIHEGAKSPKEIYKIMKDHFESKGVYEIVKTIDKKTGKERDTKVYIQNDEKIVVIPALDHGNLTKTTQEFPSKKQAIDKLVEFFQGFRDLEGAAPFWISQVNRSISGVARKQDGEHELVLEDVKESSDIVDATDLAISIFDASKYGQSSKTGYNPIDFIDKNNGSNYFRSCQILKSSYGQDSLRIPLAFNGFCGQFKELPKRNELDESQYQDLIRRVLNKSYFKEQRKLTPLKEIIKTEQEDFLT